MPSNHLILCRPLLLLPSIFPSIRVFSHNIVDVIRQIKLDPSVESILTSGELVCHKNSILKEQFCPNAFWFFGSYTPSCPTTTVLPAWLLPPVYNLSKVPTAQLQVSASLGVSQHTQLVGRQPQGGYVGVGSMVTQTPCRGPFPFLQVFCWCICSPYFIIALLLLLRVHLLQPPHTPLDGERQGYRPQFYPQDLPSPSQFLSDCLLWGWRRIQFSKHKEGTSRKSLIAFFSHCHQAASARSVIYKYFRWLRVSCLKRPRFLNQTCQLMSLSSLQPSQGPGPSPRQLRAGPSRPRCGVFRGLCTAKSSGRTGSLGWSQDSSVCHLPPWSPQEAGSCPPVGDCVCEGSWSEQAVSVSRWYHSPAMSGLWGQATRCSQQSFLVYL